MEFPESYFEDEVREGFFIPALMKRAWAAQMKVLEIVGQICEKHHIRYFAEWGTLLGAVRHGGRIPWDDDIDICMLRGDYDKFCEVADRELPEECWFWDCRTTENYDNLVGRVLNSRVHVVEGDLLEKYHGYPYVAGLDIFWLDSIPANPQAEERYREIYNCTVQLLYRTRQEKCENVMHRTEEFEYHLEKLEKLSGMKINRNENLQRQLYQIQVQAGEMLCQKYGSNEITNVPAWMRNPNYRLPKKNYEEVVWLPFENTKLPSPAGYEDILSIKYGSGWREPIRSGGAHEYPSYKKQQEFLEETEGAKLYAFRYSKQMEEEKREKKFPAESLKEKVTSVLPLFSEVHKKICEFLTKQEYDLVLQLLADCQEMAIQIGTLVEEEKGALHPFVKQMEQYCEMIFELHTKLTGGQVPDTDVLSEFDGRLAEELETWKEKKVVVFIPYKASLWGSLDALWRAAVQEEDTDVYVIPASYYYKDAYGRVKKEEPHLELEGYPEKVVITNYENFDFSKFRPDEMVIQCPYDEYNYGLTLHPLFYSKNLMKYTEHLIYVPAFMMDEIGPADDRARETLKSYCNTPGVVYSDRVLVQSEQMRKVYVELLTEFAGEDTRETWERKIGVLTPRSGDS